MEALSLLRISSITKLTIHSELQLSKNASESQLKPSLMSVDLQLLSIRKLKHLSLICRRLLLWLNYANWLVKNLVVILLLLLFGNFLYGAIDLRIMNIFHAMNFLLTRLKTLFSASTLGLMIQEATQFVQYSTQESQFQLSSCTSMYLFKSLCFSTIIRQRFIFTDFWDLFCFV